MNPKWSKYNSNSKIKATMNIYYYRNTNIHYKWSGIAFAQYLICHSKDQSLALTMAKFPKAIDQVPESKLTILCP